MLCVLCVLCVLLYMKTPVADAVGDKQGGKHFVGKASINIVDFHCWDKLNHFLILVCISHTGKNLAAMFLQTHKNNTNTNKPQSNQITCNQIKSAPKRG